MRLGIFPGRPAFLLVEALIGVAIFAITAVAAYGILLQGQKASIGGGDRVRATLLSERALEASRSMRDANWASLTAGAHGVAVGSNGLWTFSGSQMTADQFTTKLTVTTLASDWVGLSAITTWNHGVQGSGSVTLSTELTDWRKSLGGNWSSITLQGNYVDSGTPLFNDVAIRGNYAFVTSEGDGSDGLYVFNIANLASPSRVASSFDLGTKGYDLAVKANVLYVVTGDNNAEIRAYNISSPASLSAGNLITSYNLPGSGLGRSMMINGNTLYVGANESNAASRDEFYTFDVTNTGSIILRDSLDDTGSMNDISIRGTTAYLASTADTSEVRVVNVADSANISFLGGYNLTDVHDGIAILAFGTGTLMGRVAGAAIDELIRFALGSNPVPSTPPGPWYREIGGDVNAMAMDVSECAAFLATTNATKELQIVNGRNTSLAEFTSYNTTTGDGRGITFDPALDRLFMVTNKALLIFQPAAGPWTCP